MAKQVLTNVRAFLSAADLTGYSNKVELATKYEDKETTNYGSGGVKERIAGLVTTDISAMGQWDALDDSYVDGAVFNNRGSSQPFSVAPGGAAAGSLAYLTQLVWFDYKLFGSAGDVAPWEISAGGNYPLVRGAVAWSPATAISADANGTGVQLGAVALGKRLYATLHVQSISGGSSPSLAMKIQSASSNSFTSPTDEITFTSATTIGGQISRTSGSAITNTWFRAVADITDGGVSASFVIAMAFGIA